MSASYHFQFAMIVCIIIIYYFYKMKFHKDSCIIFILVVVLIAFSEEILYCFSLLEFRWIFRGCSIFLLFLLTNSIFGAFYPLKNYCSFLVFWGIAHGERGMQWKIVEFIWITILRKGFICSVVALLWWIDEKDG